MTKKTVKKNTRGNTVDLQTFLTASSVDSWAEEMEGEPTTTTTTPSSNAASTTSTGVTLEELRANSDGMSHGGRFNNSGFGHRENNYSRELGNNATAKVKPSSFYSEGAPQKSSNFGGESSSYERRERRPQQQNELPTERPFVAFIGNLSFNATKDDLQDFFGESSPINVSLPKDKETQRPKGYGYVEFDTVEDLKFAIGLNGTDFMGRNIKIDIASPDTAAKVTIDNRDSFRGGNRRDGGFRRNDDNNFERNLPESVADKSDNWRTGGDLEVNPFGNKKNTNTTRKPQGGRPESGSTGFGSSGFGSSGGFGSFSKQRSEDSKPVQRQKQSLFGEGKAWEPKEKDLKALEPNLDILASKKKAPQQKKESTQGAESQEGEFQTATSKPRGGRRYAQQTTRGGFSNNNTTTSKKGTSSKKSEEEEQQDSLESKNQYAALSEQHE